MAEVSHSSHDATSAAKRLLAEFSDASSIDTANGTLCKFILAAAKVAIENEDFAQAVAAKMPESG